MPNFTRTDCELRPTQIIQTDCDLEANLNSTWTKLKMKKKAHFGQTT